MGDSNWSIYWGNISSGAINYYRRAKGAFDLDEKLLNLQITRSEGLLQEGKYKDVISLLSGTREQKLIVLAKKAGERLQSEANSQYYSKKYDDAKSIYQFLNSNSEFLTNAQKTAVANDIVFCDAFLTQANYSKVYALLDSDSEAGNVITRIDSYFSSFLFGRKWMSLDGKMTIDIGSDGSVNVFGLDGRVYLRDPQFKGSKIYDFNQLLLVQVNSSRTIVVDSSLTGNDILFVKMDN